MIKHLSRFALKYGLMPVAHYLVRAYLLLIKIKAVNEDMGLQHLRSGHKMIVAIWHQRILVIMGYARRFGGYKPSVMISRSRDGEMIAKVYSVRSGDQAPGAARKLSRIWSRIWSTIK